MRRGRLPANSMGFQSIKDRKQRLNNLEQQISQERDSKRREPLYTQYANLAASCPEEVFSPRDIGPILYLTDLEDKEVVGNLIRGIRGGSKPDFLPLHHTAKLLGKKAPGETKYIYTVTETWREKTDDLSMYNLRALETFLETFSQRILPQTAIALRVNGIPLEVPYNVELNSLRENLQTKNIRAEPQYKLQKIKSGNETIESPLYVCTEIRQYIERDETLQDCLIAHVSI